MNASPPHNLWIRLFLPFAAGYFLSYLYRTVNAVIGPVLAGELALGVWHPMKIKRVYATDTALTDAQYRLGYGRY